MPRPEFVTVVDKGLFRLQLWVQPGAKKNALCGLHQGSLKLKIQAPPSEGKANKEAIAFLARQLGIKRSQLQFESGQRTRMKSILLSTDKEPDWEGIAQ
ncbi:MAG: DUF167 domain-containing protein [Desulfohalobiaceae bacterium]